MSNVLIFFWVVLAFIALVGLVLITADGRGMFSTNYHTYQRSMVLPLHAFTRLFIFSTASSNSTTHTLSLEDLKKKESALRIYIEGIKLGA